MTAPPDDVLAAMPLAAARTPGAAFAALDPPDGGARVAVFALGGEALVNVPADAPSGALDAFGDALDALRVPRHGPAVPVAFGAVTYDAAWRAASPRPVHDARPRGDLFPSAWLARLGAVMTVDAATGRVLACDDEAREAFARASEGPEAPRAWSFESATDRDAHVAAVEATRASIRDGDVYLVNIARMLHAPARPDDPAVRDAVAALVRRASARYACVAWAGGALVGATSMELGLSWDRARGLARSRPIKGTRPRRDDPDDDAREAAALANDPKERAENAMAVDVHRNDLGRVARVGGVRVAGLFEAEAHRFVHHLASTVEADVPGETPAREVLRAMLPVGSVTGAPKLAAMAHIAAHERESRGLYTGAYGVAWSDGSLSLAVAIRTLVVDEAGAHYGAGGGIVWDSDAAREWEELAWKSRALTMR